MGARDLSRARMIEPEAQRLHKEIAALSAPGPRIGREVNMGVSGALNQWLPRIRELKGGRQACGGGWPSIETAAEDVDIWTAGALTIGASIEIV